MKSSRDLERIVRAFSNHHRINILVLLKKDTELTVDDIASSLDINFKTASEHIRRLTISGLVTKRYEGTNVHHKLTPRGKSILEFLRILE